jgi:UDP-N-acetylglucosamine diphosphorylase / glucose-1-phosphate thymidylyltransferase / UDP-N-acetylgalactosamine diphosphorylase / glucosamine-1-phosphate N-acetyltransferase / galactosamine-1-phosphate N-acetyltransferase
VISSKLALQGVILAAGRGSRLHPLTLKRSKAMIPVMGKPMVARVLDLFAANGVNEVVMVVSQDDVEIRRYFEHNADFPGTIQFVEQPERLGMANALSLAAPHLSRAFVLSACDNLIPAAHLGALIHAFASGKAAGALSLMQVPRDVISRTGIVEWDGAWVRRIVEKPRPEEAPSDISSLPLYVFDREILKLLPHVPRSPRGEYELQDAIQMLIEQTGRVTGVFTQERLQLTNAADLLSLNRHYLTTGGDSPQLAPSQVGQHTHLITPLRIEEGTTIGPGCVIGPRVYIERNCRIGANVLLKDAVVLRDSIIEDGRQIVGEVIS